MGHGKHPSAKPTDVATAGCNEAAAKRRSTARASGNTHSRAASFELWSEARIKHTESARYLRDLVSSRDEGEAEPDVQWDSGRFSTQADIGGLRAYVRGVVSHDAFDAVVGMIVIANSVIIALEQHYRLEKTQAHMLTVLENIFLTIYIVELMLRIFSCGLAQLRDRALLFDILLVAISIMVQWIAGPTDLEELRPLMVVRIARLARCARSVRLIMLFRDLWQLVQGLLSSAGIMFYTLILLFVLLFVFALVGVELITIPHLREPSPDPVVGDIIEEHFSNLGLAMLTLTQVVTLDSVSQIYRPLVINEPFLAVYFLSAILVIGIVLMNLITAVLVNGAMECAQQNKEATRMYEDRKKKTMLKELRGLFMSVDEDGSGKIDILEALNASDEIADFIRHNIPAADLVEVFDQLDIDGDGDLDIHEFCDGLYHAMTEQLPMKLRRIDRRIHGLDVHVSELLSAQADMSQMLSEMSGAAQRNAQRSSPCAIVPSSVGADLLSGVSHVSAYNQEDKVATLERHEHPCAVDAPAWGRQILLELSMLREHAAKAFAMPFENVCSKDLGSRQSRLPRATEFCSSDVVSIANEYFDCAACAGEAPVSHPRGTPHLSAGRAPSPSMT